MANAVARIPKPDMTNPQKRYLLREAIKATIYGFIGSTAWYFYYVKPYTEAEEHFYKTYDPYADFERMRNLGLFQCCPPDDVLAERAKQKKKK